MDAINTATTATDTQARQGANNADTIARDAQARKVSEGETKLIMDGPWALLWPCFILWPFNEAVVGFAWINNAVGKWTLVVLVSNSSRPL